MRMLKSTFPTQILNFSYLNLDRNLGSQHKITSTYKLKYQIVIRKLRHTS